MLSYLPLMVSCHANSFGLVEYLTLKCMFSVKNLNWKNSNIPFLEKVWLLLWIIQTNKLYKHVRVFIQISRFKSFTSLIPDLCLGGGEKDGPLSLDLIFWENNPGFYHDFVFEPHFNNISAQTPQSCSPNPALITSSEVNSALLLLLGNLTQYNVLE